MLKSKHTGQLKSKHSTQAHNKWTKSKRVVQHRDEIEIETSSKHRDETEIENETRCNTVMIDEIEIEEHTNLENAGE